MSVATRTLNLPCLNPDRAALRCDWLLLPWIRAQATPLLSRKSASLFARCFVRVKTRTLPWMTPPSSSRNSPCLRSVDTGYTLCVMRGAGPATWPMFRRTGSRSRSRDSSTIGSGMVAENSMVWRSFGRRARMRLMSGRKPMSSILSASSRTSQRRSPSET